MSKFLDITMMGAVKGRMNRLRALFALNSYHLSDEDRRQAVLSRIYRMGYRYNRQQTDLFSDERPQSPDHVMVFTRPHAEDKNRLDFVLLSNRKCHDTYSRITSFSTLTFFDQPKAPLWATEFYPDVPEIKNWKCKTVVDFLSKTELPLIKKHIGIVIQNFGLPDISV